MKKRIQTNGIIIALAFICVLFFPKVFFRGSSCGLSENILEGIGLISVLLGQLIRVSARGYKAEYSKNSHALIEGGPYQIVRNPMYLGILLIGLGVVFILFNWWVAIVFMVIYLWRYLPLIFTEEKKLKGMFGATYETYCSRVPRILPRPSNLIKIRPSEYLPLKRAWFKKEVHSIIAVLIVILLLLFGKR